MAFKKGHVPWNIGITGKDSHSYGSEYGFKKGHTPWNKDKPWPKELREKWSEEKKGITFNTGRTHIKKGQRLSQKTEFKKGHIPRNKNKPMPEETREILRQIRLNNPTSGQFKKGHAGLKLTLSKERYEEFLRKQARVRQKQWHSKEPTSIEKKLYDELKSRGLLFEKQKLINGKFLVDAYIPSLNLIIEADGDYWHNLDKVKKRDKAKNAYLKKCDFNLLRLWETEINDDSFKEKLDKEVN